MRDRFAAMAILFAALLACGGVQSERWEPRSSDQPSNQIAKTCVRMYRGDIKRVAKAGGLPIGTLTVTAVNADAMDPALDSAAEYGGTHCLMLTESDSDETSTMVVQTWGNGTTSVTPVRAHKHEVRLLVVRVPRSGWEALPSALTPATK